MRGTASFTKGNQEYSLCERSTNCSGLLPKAAWIAEYRPIQIGIWMIMGPKQPTGLTPASLKSAICSLERRALSSLYFAWSSLMRGWIACIFFVDCSCRIVNGYIRIRVTIVKAMMAMPKLEPRMA